MPVLIIFAILVAVGIPALGTSAGISKKQVEKEVTELLEGVPQRGPVLGSPKAPVTVRLFADLECPTVKLFVENYLPSIIGTWVRTGAVKLDYRSFQTDTSDERVFFTQETAALAAGRQNRMWNFLLTSVREQGEPRTDYMSEEFLADVASQVPGLGSEQWHRDRDDARLSKQVALGVYSGTTSGITSTPSLLVDFSEEEAGRPAASASLIGEVEATLQNELRSLREESLEDFPTLKGVSPDVVGG